METPDEALVERLRLSAMRLGRRMCQESGNEIMLTPSRYSALSTIEANSPLRMTDLARAERVSKSSITRIVGMLAEMALVELVPDPSDGRSTLVYVTSQGTQTLDAITASTDAFLKQQISEFSDVEKLMLEATVLLLDRLAASTTRHLGSVDGDVY